MRKLRACDLVPGRIYFSPSGRLCKLLEPAGFGPAVSTYIFAYLSRRGNASLDDGFSIATGNAKAIAAMSEAPLVIPQFVGGRA